MPKGHATIKWDDANNMKLFSTVLKTYPGHPDCEKIATDFGGGVDAQAIRNRLGKIRRAGAAADLGLTVQSPTSLAKTGAGAPSTPAKSGNVKLKGSPVVKKEVSSDSDEGIISRRCTLKHTKSATPSLAETLGKTIGGRVAKPRVSPRKPNKKNYKALADPFAGTEAADHAGTEIFESRRSSSEDTDPSDEEYGKEKKGFSGKHQIVPGV